MRTMIPGWLSVVAAWMLAAVAVGAAEITIQTVDLNGLACGECAGTVAVVIEIDGVFAVGDTIEVELAVTPSELGRVTHSASTRVETSGASMAVTFDGVEIPECHLRPNTFEVEAEVAGTVAARMSSAVITRRCPHGEGS